MTSPRGLVPLVLLAVLVGSGAPASAHVAAPRPDRPVLGGLTELDSFAVTAGGGFVTSTANEYGAVTRWTRAGDGRVVASTASAYEGIDAVSERAGVVSFVRVLGDATTTEVLLEQQRGDDLPTVIADLEPLQLRDSGQVFGLRELGDRCAERVDGAEACLGRPRGVDARRAVLRGDRIGRCGHAGPAPASVTAGPLP